MTTNNERAFRLDRATRYVITARLLDVDDATLYDIADQALDTDTIDDPRHDALLCLAAASFTSDDDYDDFRHELRVMLGPPFADDNDANWNDDGHDEF